MKWISKKGVVRVQDFRLIDKSMIHRYKIINIMVHELILFIPFIDCLKLV
jgi:hypothetical protein